MTSRTSRIRGRALATAAKQLLLVLLSLGALALGSVLDGRALWFHAHGDGDWHVHVAPAEADSHDHDGLRDWHDARHHGSDDGDERSPQPLPNVLSIELADLGVSAPSDPGLVAATRSLASVCSYVARWQLAGAPTTHRPEVCRSGWPPQRADASGIVALMRSSHALLL